MWELNFKWIQAISSLSIAQFLIVMIDVLVFPKNLYLMLFNAIVSMVQIVIEVKQIKNDGWEYLSQVYNYLDLGGNIAIVLTAFNYAAYGDEFFKSESRKAILIFAIIGLGLRALT